MKPFPLANRRLREQQVQGPRCSGPRGAVFMTEDLGQLEKKRPRQICPIWCSYETGLPIWLRCWWRCWWRFWCCSKMGEVCWRAQLRKSVWRETRPTMLTPEPEPSAELSIAPGKVNQHLQPHQPPTTKTISSIISPICVVFLVKLPIMFGVRWCYNSQPWNGDFQSMGVPPNHPFYVRIFHYKHL